MVNGAVHARKSSKAGFTLLETLVATLLFSSAVAGVAQVIVLGTAANLAARDMTQQNILAAQKLNELVTAELASLVPSSPDAWLRTSAGYIEYLDRFGVVVSTSISPPSGAMYIRRWSITPLPSDPAGGVALQVGVSRVRVDSNGSVADALPFASARVIGIRTGFSS